MQYRSKSGERALQELKHLLSRYPTRSIQVVDNILDMKYFETFLPRIESERLQLDLYYEVKANLRRDQVMQLARAGVRCLQPGIESLSDPILRLMRKGVTALQNIQLLRLCKENGIHAYWNLICGFPGEPEAEYLRMAQLVPLLAHLTPPVVCGPLRLDRFSPNFERPAEHGFRNVRPRPAYSHIYPFAPASVADLAYFFDFDHADGAQPERYSAALVEAVEEWQLDHQQSHLVFVDKGDVAFVFDLRPTARHSSRSLAGVDRAVLLACCDRIQTQESLRTLFAERGKPIDQTELQDSLARLVEDRFAIRHDSRYLGLPLDANSLGSSLVQREQRADDALVARA
jgi:ribosomal peptide maturation radical SAM protein 1